MSVETFLIGRLSPSDDGVATVKVTVRLDAAEYEGLKDVAKRIDMSPTGAGGRLLGEAIQQAKWFLNHETELQSKIAEGAAERDSDFRARDSSKEEAIRSAAYREGVEQGKAEEEYRQDQREHDQEMAKEFAMLQAE